MKITGIQTHVCHAYRTNWVFVKVLTDMPGLYGVGEATLEYRELTVVQACQESDTRSAAVPRGDPLCRKSP